MSNNKLVECASTGTKLPEQIAREVDNLTKTLPSDCGYRTKAIAADAINFEPGERAEVSVLTTSSVDKTNEVVLPEGVDLDAYRKSRVVLWNHDQERPVASCKWIKHYRDSIRAKTCYPEGGPQLTEDAWLMTKSGILKAKSIGFIPRKPLREATQEELELHPEWKGAGLWDDVLLIEYSCCTVGMNNDALVEMVNTKGWTPETFMYLGIPEMEVKATDQPAMPPEEFITQAVVEEVVKTVPAWIVKAESDPCVADKIKYMHDHGETSKYSDAQIVAIAYSMCKGTKKTKKKKSIDINKVLADALGGITLDVDAMARKALEGYRSRGRV